MKIKKNRYRLLCLLLCCVLLAGTLQFTAAAAGTAPVITKQPVNALTSRTEKTWIEFSLTAEGSTALSYQWQISTYSDGKWENLDRAADWCSGVNTSCLRVYALLALELSVSYRCIVADANGNTEISNAVHIQYAPDLSISEQPVNTAKAAVGSWIEFALTAEGQPGLSYQWEFEYNHSGNWFTIVGSESLYSGVNTATLRVCVKNDEALYRYRCTVRDADGNTGVSNIVRMTSSATELSVTKHPVNYVTTSTDKLWVEYSLTAQGSGTLTYQWQCDEKSTGDWKNLPADAGYCSGANSNCLRLLCLPELESISRYRCLIADQSHDTAYSNIVRLELEPALNIYRHPTDAPGGANGTYAQFSLNASGLNLKYQWQFEYGNSGTWFSIVGSENTFPGATTDCLRVLIGNDTAGYRFRCFITDGYGNAAYSNIVRVLPSNELTITRQPQNASGREGGLVSFYVAVSGGTAPYTYQWQTFSQGVLWEDLKNDSTTVSGAKTDRLDLVISKNDWTTHEDLRCVIKDSAGKTVISNEVKAVWEGPSAYSVTFEANGGSGVMLTDYAEVEPDGYAEYILPECGYTAPQGKEFESWFVLNGSGNPSVFAYEAEPGDYIYVKGNINVRALWRDSTDPCEGYTDINRSAWYHTAADFVIERGLMGSTKTDKLTFEPNTKVSRAMVASILYRMANSPAVTYKATFTDVPSGKWFTAAIEWCAQNGLASGKGNGKFDPNGNVTRQELAVFMKKMAEYLGKNTDSRDDLTSFADASKVPSWAKDYVAWAVSAGLISGKASNGKTYLAPTDNATRAEFASIIMRFVRNIAES